jgi:hypothetical protein
MTKPMMMCGHAANATNAATGAPICAICAGMTPNAKIVDTTVPDLDGRVAICSYAQRSTDPEGFHQGGGQYARQQFKNGRESSTSLAFFKHQPAEATDQFYCGCWGWD